tara:strand:- start:14713 stop:15840 length:1128 start_codon:yes stop_codon:yes gene_type:complete
MKRNNSIDILRAVAVLSVLLTHIGTYNPSEVIGKSINDVLLFLNNNLIWANQGLHGGVIIFIVVSGFCIHMGNRSIVNKDFLKIYTIRRFFRIYPLLIFALILGYTVVLISKGSYVDSFSEDAIFLPSNLVFKDFLLNFLSSIFLFYSALPVQPPLGNAILGTVLVECMLYAFYPLIIRIIDNRWKLLIFFFFILHLLSFSLIYFTSLEPTWIQRNFFTVALYWWLGVYSAEIMLSNKEKNNVKLLIKKKATMSLVIWIFYITFSNMLYFKGSHIVKSLILAILISYLLTWILSLKQKQNILIKILVFLGTISYSIYAIQFPISYLFQFYLLKYDYIQFFYIFSYVGIFMISYLCYVLIEKPSHNYGKSLTAKFL